LTKTKNPESDPTKTKNLKLCLIKTKNPESGSTKTKNLKSCLIKTKNSEFCVLRPFI
jgi:hypothetical protein